MRRRVRSRSPGDSQVTARRQPGASARCECRSNGLAEAPTQGAHHAAHQHLRRPRARPSAPGRDRPTGPPRTRRARQPRPPAPPTSASAMNAATIAGVASTLMFAGSTLPMVVRAARTRDVSSYSRSHLVMTNAGNAVHTVYVASLPPGPVWLLHCMYSCRDRVHVRRPRAVGAEPDCCFGSRVPGGAAGSTMRLARGLTRPTEPAARMALLLSTGDPVGWQRAGERPGRV